MARNAGGEALEVNTLARPLAARRAAASVSPLAPQHPAPVQRQRLRFVAAHTHTGARSLYGSNVSLSSRDGVKVRVFYQPPSSWSQPDESFTATARTTSNTECLLARTQLYSVGPRPLPLFSPCGSRVFPARGSLPVVFGGGGEWLDSPHPLALRGGLVVTRWLLLPQRSLDSLSIVPWPGRSRCRRLDSRAGS